MANDEGTAVVEPLEVFISLGISETYLRIGDIGRRNPKPELIDRTLEVLRASSLRSAAEKGGKP